jgi:CBS-domain-containing membrane protein
MRPSEERPLDRSKSSVADLQARGLLDPFSVVGTDTEFEELVRAVRAQPQVRTVAVTDDDGRLTGIIPMRAFYGALMADVYPGVVMADVVSFESALQYGDHMVHPTADQFMLDAESVSLSDTLHDAFIALHRSGQAGLPVVDADERPVGYLDLLAILPLWEQRA